MTRSPPYSSADLSWSLFPVFGSLYDPMVTGAILTVVAAAITITSRRRTLAPAKAQHPG